MTRERALERETKITNCELTPQAIWQIEKTFTKRGAPKASSVIHDFIGPIFCPVDKANIIVNCL
jgi:hypothetical protein